VLVLHVRIGVGFGDCNVEVVCVFVIWQAPRVTPL